MKEQNIGKIREYLKKLGLAEKEANAYLYIHSHGPQIVSALAKGCGLTRTHAYDIVRQLEERGLCHSLGSEYGKKIKTLSSKQLLDLLEQKENELSGLKSGLKAIIPLLDSLDNYRPTEKSQLSYFRGAGNVRKLLNQSLHAEEPLIRLAGSEIDLLEKLGEEYLVNYQTRRKDKRIKLHGLRPGLARGHHAAFAHDQEYLQELRLRPEGKIKLKSNILLWDSSVAIFSLQGEVAGTLIESPDLSAMMKSWFDFIWEQSSIIR